MLQRREITVLTENASRELIKLNCLLAKFTRSHHHSDTFQLFHQIHSSHHLKPDQYTLSTTLTACANTRNAIAGSQLHAHAFKTAFKTYPHVANTLLSLYAKSEDLVSVKRHFDEIKNPDVYSWTTLLSACTKLGEVGYACILLDEKPQRNEAVWNAVITGCVDNGYAGIALDLFQRMHVLGVRHDNYSFASVLSLCTLERLDFGRKVHSLVIKSGFLVRASVINALLSMYFNCGSVSQACDVFAETEMLVHDEITYNAMIAGLVGAGRDVAAFIMFRDMLKVCLRPSELSFVSVMSSCLCARTAIQVHNQSIKTGFEHFTSVGNAAITMYSSFGDLQAARVVFRTLEKKDNITWNTIIASYAQGNFSREAMMSYMQMQCEGFEPDEYTIGSLLTSSELLVHIEMVLAVVLKSGLISKVQVSNAIVSAYSKHGEINEAYYVFSETRRKNLISWNSMISGFQSNGFPIHGLDQFSQMLLSELRPNVYTLSIVLSICASISALRLGKQVHGYVLKFGYFPEISIGNTLVTLYAKCGALNWSSRVFNMMPNKDVISWNSMISAFSQHGDGKEAVQCFEEMQTSGGVRPDKATFTAVLSACSHAGLVDNGICIFNAMVNKYGSEPGVDHFSCIVDLLGRAGHLDAAEGLTNYTKFNIDPIIWWTLFSSCAAHGNLRLGRIVAGLLLETEENNSAVYVLLSNILADAGHWEEAAAVREMTKNCGAVKLPGCSWIAS